MFFLVLPMSLLFFAFLANDVLKHARILSRTVRKGQTSPRAEMRNHVLYDDWIDFSNSSLDSYWISRKGYIYLATNPIFRDCFKIGKTKNLPGIRIKQLNNESVLGKFELVSWWRVHDCHYLEKEIHRELRHFTIQKEFFAGTYLTLIPQINAVIAADIQKFNFEFLPVRT